MSSLWLSLPGRALVPTRAELYLGKDSLVPGASPQDAQLDPQLSTVLIRVKKELVAWPQCSPEPPSPRANR